MNSADLVWVSISTVLVLMMVVPGLALFYGGLVRAKNILSVLAQVLAVFFISARFMVRLWLLTCFYRRHSILW